MPEYVLDTVVLRVMAFAHPKGIDVLLEGLAARAARFPAEVYNQDERTVPLEQGDEDLSELARGLRYAERQAIKLPFGEAQRYKTWLQRAGQVVRLITTGALVIDPLTADELLRREFLMQQYGIGRGEAACLVLVERYKVQGVFLSSDEPACKVAHTLELPYLTLPQVLESWVTLARPPIDQLEALVAGMRLAKFGLKPDFVEKLRRIL